MIHHLDVKSAFLNGEIEEVIYVKQLEGFAVKGKEGHVLCLRKALYGLKQDKSLVFKGPQVPNLTRIYQKQS